MRFVDLLGDDHPNIVSEPAVAFDSDDFREQIDPDHDLRGVGRWVHRVLHFGALHRAPWHGRGLGVKFSIAPDGDDRPRPALLRNMDLRLWS